MTEQELLKEALEWQEHIRKLITATDDELYHKRSKVFDWLINRVEELEEERDEWKDTAQSYYMTNQELRERNQRYKRALEFYAERDNYQWEVSYRPQQEIDCMVIDDSGHTARKALEGDDD